MLQCLRSPQLFARPAKHHMTQITMASTLGPEMHVVAFNTGAMAGLHRKAASPWQLGQTCSGNTMTQSRDVLGARRHSRWRGSNPQVLPLQFPCHQSVLLPKTAHPPLQRDA
eukprot:scaffold157228_cov41-Tisochrysis_lutea.AAC.2